MSGDLVEAATEQAIRYTYDSQASSQFGFRVTVPTNDKQCDTRLLNKYITLASTSKQSKFSKFCSINWLYPAIVIFDYFLTFSDEIRTIWLTRYTMTSAIFIINRYISLAGYIVVVYFICVPFDQITVRQTAWMTQYHSYSFSFSRMSSHATFLGL